MARRITSTPEPEDLPEADRLEGFPHPRETVKVFGHEAEEKMLAETFSTGRMHHGWLLAGREGIGKATLAYRFARYVLADDADREPFGVSLDVPPESTAARQVRALSHPGLLVLRRPYNFKDKRFAASIPVDEMRRLRAFLGLSAGGQGYRVVIVDTAEDLNASSANAILKSLEEPPPQTYFLIVASEPGRVLPTIRSRVRTLDLKPLEPQAMRAAVVQATAAAGAEIPMGKAWEQLLKLANGSVRRLLSLSATGGLGVHEKVQRIVEGLPRMDWHGAHALSDELAGLAAEQKLELFFELLLDAIARLVRCEATGIPEDDRALAHRVIGPARLATFAELWETVAREKSQALALNLDRKTLVLSTLARLEAAAAP